MVYATSITLDASDGRIAEFATRERLQSFYSMRIGRALKDGAKERHFLG